jgi:hypothetical protein
MKILVPTLEESSAEFRAGKLRGRQLAEAIKACKETVEQLAKQRGGDSDDHASRIAKIASGQPVEAVPDADLLYKQAMSAWADQVEASELHHKSQSPVRLRASTDICAKLKPAHDALLKRLSAALVIAHEANSEYFDLQTDLIAQEIAFCNLCDMKPFDILGSPREKSSLLGDFLRQAKSKGFIAAVPKEFA